MKLFKFRPLTSDTTWSRAIEILCSGKFWCSKFCDLNDPMEGVYLSDAAPTTVKQLLSAKAGRRICSFSSGAALRNPLMWGYYADGFKGIVIECEVEPDSVHEIEYSQRVVQLTATDPYENQVTRILTSKFSSWKHEHEIRFLSSIDTNPQAIGKITGVYIGMPYHDIDNSLEVAKQSKALAEYQQRAQCIGRIAKQFKLKVWQASMPEGKVEIRPFKLRQRARRRPIPRRGRGE